jgi:hypothetical protein
MPPWQLLMASNLTPNLAVRHEDLRTGTGISAVQICRLSGVLHSDALHPCLGEDFDKNV